MSDLELELEPLDASSQGGSAKESAESAYEGPERRSGHDRRESAGDRREQVRFDAYGGDRRSGKDRRRQDNWNGSRNDRW